MNQEAISSGRRNLLLLGAAALLLTLLTTGFELWLYRSSGDIYLDRSRPGFLPDPEEAEAERKDPETTYTYSDTGPLNKTELQEYLKELKAVDAHLRQIASPFSAAPLSDESLGLTVKEASEKTVAE